MATLQQQQRAPRLVAFLTVALTDGVAHYVVDTENVSEAGLCLCPRKLFPVGTNLHLVFGQPPDLPAVSTEGIVKWFEHGKGVGVQFTSLTAADRQALVKFVASQRRTEQT